MNFYFDFIVLYIANSPPLTDTVQITPWCVWSTMHYAIDSSIYSNKHMNFKRIEANAIRPKWRRKRIVSIDFEENFTFCSTPCLWSYSQLRNQMVLLGSLVRKLILMSKTRKAYNNLLNVLNPQLSKVSWNNSK